MAQKKTVSFINSMGFRTSMKQPELYRLHVSPPRKRTKTSSSTPNLKSPLTRTPSLLKNLFQFQNINIFSNGFPHLFGVEDPVEMSLSCFGLDINRKLEIYQHISGGTGIIKMTLP